jgi:hypothetical protein
MRWFIGLVVAAIVAILLLAYVGFFTGFKPNDWTTFVLAVLAFLGTIFGLLRGRVGQPHWRKVHWLPRLERKEQLRVGGVGVAPAHSELHFKTMNVGPGVAERVEYQLKRPGGKWSEAKGLRARPDFDRHEWFNPSMIGWEGTAKDVPVGKYKVKLIWSALPDTGRRHKKVFKKKIIAPAD